MKPAISTVACPEWTLERVFEFARKIDVTGVELRTFGDDSSQFAPDPCLTDFAKIRRLSAQSGVSIACLATSIRYDAPIFPPVVGRVVSQTQIEVRATKRMIDVAREVKAPFVRVFAFELGAKETRKAGLRRIIERMELAAACARNTGVRLLIENGGSFATAEDLNEIMDRLASTHVAAAYCPAVAQSVGEDPVEGVRMLGERLESVKLKDFVGTTAVPIGHGEMHCREVVEELARRNYGGWAVIEWDRLWLSGLEAAERVLPQSVADLMGWYAGARAKAGPRAMAMS
ncbi:MAG: sugar phosphate isomerase/epimerase [Phycisphaeraceae bacterium]|nr:sugar phosphate isomerase/epimerase [Phycisphaeraceae bacterium]